MKKTLRIALPLISAVMLSVTSAHAGTQTGTYVAATAVSSTAGGRCVSQASTCVALLGGFQIPAGKTTISVTITDATGPGAPYTVCQRNGTAGTFCGDDAAKDVSYSTCSTAAPKSFTGFNAANPINVFIFAADTTCEGSGTTGTYKVTWA